MSITGKVAIVSGDTSGIGRQTAEQLEKLGYAVYGFSRRAAASGPVRHIQVDVSDYDSVMSGVNEVIAQCGRIDLLIANAGFGIAGSVEYTKQEDARAQMDINFYGFFNCAKAALPYIRKTSGRIIAVSSVAAALSIPFQAFYSASKSAVSALCLALDNEIRPFGARAIVVLPGDVATGFTDARRKSTQSEGEYHETMVRSVERMEKDERGGMKPEYAASKIVEISQKPNPKPMYTIGSIYKVFMILNKLFPARLVRYIVGRMYAK